MPRAVFALLWCLSGSVRTKSNLSRAFFANENMRLDGALSMSKLLTRDGGMDDGLVPSAVFLCGLAVGLGTRLRFCSMFLLRMHIRGLLSAISTSLVGLSLVPLFGFLFL